MKQKHKPQITIPSPCHERWNEMTPNEQGRFCSMCQKTVTDYTQMSDQQLLDIIRSGSMGCGRFLDTQLNRELIPQKKVWPFFSSNLIKKIAASLLILQSITHSAWAQTKAGEIHGTITDQQHQPISGIVVQVKSGNRIIGGAVTDLDGNYSIKPLSAGYYTVVTPTAENVGYKISTAPNIEVMTEKAAVVNLTLVADELQGPDINIVQGGVPLVTTETIAPVPTTGTAEQIELIVPPKKSFWQRINIFKKRK